MSYKNGNSYKKELTEKNSLSKTEKFLNKFIISSDVKNKNNGNKNNNVKNKKSKSIPNNTSENKNKKISRDNYNIIKSNPLKESSKNKQIIEKIKSFKNCTYLDKIVEEDDKNNEVFFGEYKDFYLIPTKVLYKICSTNSDINDIKEDFFDENCLEQFSTYPFNESNIIFELKKTNEKLRNRLMWNLINKSKNKQKQKNKRQINNKNNNNLNDNNSKSVKDQKMTKKMSDWNLSQKIEEGKSNGKNKIDKEKKDNNKIKEKIDNNIYLKYLERKIENLGKNINNIDVNDSLYDQSKLQCFKENINNDDFFNITKKLKEDFYGNLDDNFNKIEKLLNILEK